MKRILNNIFLVIFLLFLFGLFFSWLGSSNLFAPVKTISLNEVVQKIKNNQVEEIILKGEKITLRTKGGEELVSYKEASQGLLETLKEFGLTNEDLKGVKINVKSEAGSNFWLGIILSHLEIILISSTLISSLFSNNTFSLSTPFKIPILFFPFLASISTSALFSAHL